jgi:hypothetical protein
MSTAEYRFYDLSDCVQEKRKFVAVPNGEAQFATCSIEDFPPELAPSRKSGLRLKLRDDMWDGQGRNYLVRTGHAKQKDLLGYGVRFDDSGPYIERKKTTPFELTRYLPSMAHTLLVGHAIPATSWGANLHRLLKDECWQALRKESFEKTNLRCEICGVAGNLECHELWEYYEPVGANTTGRFGVQELKGLLSLCFDCHQAHHLGFANLNGRLDRALGHVGYLNQWSKEQVALYYKYISATWQRRSSSHWMLDLAILPNNSAITLKEQWTMIENRFITARVKTGEAVTKLLGIHWRPGQGGDEYLTKVHVKRVS